MRESMRFSNADHLRRLLRIRLTMRHCHAYHIQKMTKCERRVGSSFDEAPAKPSHSSRFARSMHHVTQSHAARVCSCASMFGMLFENEPSCCASLTCQSWQSACCAAPAPRVSRQYRPALSSSPALHTTKKGVKALRRKRALRAIHSQFPVGGLSTPVRIG